MFNFRTKCGPNVGSKSLPTPGLVSLRPSAFRRDKKWWPSHGLLFSEPWRIFIFGTMSSCIYSCADKEVSLSRMDRLKRGTLVVEIADPASNGGRLPWIKLTTMRMTHELERRPRKWKPSHNTLTLLTQKFTTEGEKSSQLAFLELTEKGIGHVHSGNRNPQGTTSAARSWLYSNPLTGQKKQKTKNMLLNQTVV